MPSQDSSKGFEVRKCEAPFDHNDFEWEMTQEGKENADPLYIVGENGSGAVSLANAEGAAIAELDTRWNQVCTVVQFWWDDRSYRYVVTSSLGTSAIGIPAHTTCSDHMCWQTTAESKLALESSFHQHTHSLCAAISLCADLSTCGTHAA